LNIAAFIAKRVAFNKQQSFSRFIIRLAIAATAISVAAMLVTIGFTSGFQVAVGQKMFSFSGHIRVQQFEPNRNLIAEELPVQENDTVYRVLRQDPDVKSVQVFATKNAIIKGSESIEGVQLKGIEKSYDFSNLNDFLQQGHWLHFPDSGYSNEIDVSAYTANQLKLHPGDRVDVYFIQPDGSRRVRVMKLAGIFKTGVEDYDKVIAIADIRLIQRINNWQPDQIGGYEVFLHDYRKLDSANKYLFQQLPETWNTRTIKEVYANIFDWLNLQNTTIAIVLIIMIIVAVLNLVTCLIILLLERTHMVGILKAVGSRDRSIQQIFLYHGAIITINGILIGNILGLAICWIQQRYGIITLPEDAYYISKAAVELDFWQVILVNLGTFLVCFLILMIPTIIVRRIQPVQAISFR
jgi:lipoprotein-releasing system permease protein